MSIRVEGRHVHVSRGTAAFERSVCEAVAVGKDIVVVVLVPTDHLPRNVISLDSNAGPEVRRNVYAVNHDGTVLWQIADLDLPRPGYFVGAKAHPDGALWAIHTSGFVVRLDPRTGAVLEQRFTK